MTTEHDKIHPYKANVIRELQKALDDPKRAVRREAVEARYVPEFDRGSVGLAERLNFRAAWCGAKIRSSLGD